MKDLCQKWKVKLIFRGAYGLPWTGIVECLEITDVGCNVKQFDSLTWLTLTPIFFDHLRVSSSQINGNDKMMMLMNDDDDDDAFRPRQWFIYTPYI